MHSAPLLPAQQDYWHQCTEMQTEETILAFIIQSSNFWRPTSILGLHSLPSTIIVDSVMLWVYSHASSLLHTVTNTYTVKISQFEDMETIPLDDFYTVLEPWSDIKNAHLLGTFSKKSPDSSQKWRKRTETPHGCAEISDFLMLCNSGTAQRKNFVPVTYCRATQELQNGGWIMGISPSEPKRHVRHFLWACK